MQSAGKYSTYTQAYLPSLSLVPGSCSYSSTVPRAAADARLPVPGLYREKPSSKATRRGQPGSRPPPSRTARDPGLHFFVDVVLEGDGEQIA